jgi:hypothetical protein
MRGRLGVAAVLLLAVTAVRAENRGAVDWVFLVDTSKSMRGIGGSKDIFDDVKASLTTFVDEADIGDSVSLYTFDSDVVEHNGTRDIHGSFDRNELKAIIAKLEANGKRTHLGLAIKQGLKRAEELRERPDPTRNRAVVLMTDGKEDVKGIKHPTPIPENFERVGDSWIFFVSMGEHEPQLDQFAAATKRTKVLKPQDAQAIRDAIREIRHVIQPPPPPPPKPVVVAPKPAPLPPPVKPPSPWTRPLQALAVLAILAIATLIARARYKAANQLEGEIEIVTPRVGSEAAYVGLPTLKAGEVALSAIVPVDALAGADARLFVKRKGDRKNVWIAASAGSLRVNDVETPLSELYDADTIRIGDATLRFNRVGYERVDAFTGEESL